MSRGLWCFYRNTITPIRSDVEATPVENPSDCECTTAGPDGFEDLTLKFDAQALMQLTPPGSGSREVQLSIKGKLNDGTLLMRCDGIRVQCAISVEETSWGLIKGSYR